MTHLPPEAAAYLRRNAEALLARHKRGPDGRCSFCSRTWLHTDTRYPCYAVRMAQRFLDLTG